MVVTFEKDPAGANTGMAASTTLRTTMMAGSGDGSGDDRTLSQSKKKSKYGNGKGSKKGGTAFATPSRRDCANCRA